MRTRLCAVCLALAIVAVMMAIVTACGPSATATPVATPPTDTPGPTASPVCATTPEPAPTTVANYIGDEEEQECFVPYQALLVGPPLQIEAVLLKLPERYPTIRLPVPQWRLPFMLPRPELEPLEQEVQLYQFEAKDDGVEAASLGLGGTEKLLPNLAFIFAVNLISQQEEYAVRAEPNYRTGGSSLLAACGSPHMGEGSPWPGSYCPLPAASLAAAQSAHKNQWAMTASTGIQPAGDPKTDDMGVRVGIFDTSPLAEGAAEVCWLDPSLGISVTYPVLAPYPWSVPTSAPVVRDHGLFIAGQVHLVAPGAEIGLYRALDDYARGDLATLSSMLLAFVNEATGLGRGDQPANGAVINLSLGVHTPQECLAHESTAHLGYCGLDDKLLRDAICTGALSPDVETLKTVLSAASAQGIVVVGAAGNEGARFPAAPAQAPASFLEVIAVGASNASGGPSCFSNQGDVYAPGGDGIVANSCALPDCQSPTPDNFVVGPVYGYPDSSGYAYWLGTSFAAPWVSGLAALLQQGEGPWIPPQVGRAARISDTIRGCAVANANSVVDMASSLATPPICQAPPGKIEVSLSGMAVCPTSPP